MKANELRAGNYVLFTMDSIPISNPHKLLIDDFKHIDRFIDSGNITPIRLTEKWLIKFGFEIQLVEIVLGDFYLKRTEKHFEYYCNNRVELKYVHELQNLFHDLTKKELIIT